VANLKSVKKDVRKSKKRRVHNAQQRTRLRSLDKKIRGLVAEGKADEATVVLGEFTRFLDRAGRKNLIHHRQAARRKSRIALLINKSKAAKA